MADDCIPFYLPGSDITGHVTAAVTGKRFVRISGNRSADGNVSIAPPAAGGRVFGVARWTGAAGAKVGVITQPGAIVPVFAAAAVAADQEVQVDATGAVIPLAGGVAVGRAVTAALINTDAQIELY